MRVIDRSGHLPTRLPVWVLVTYITTGWVSMLHAIQSADPGDGFVTSVLRDGTLALPVVLAGTFLAGRLAVKFRLREMAAVILAGATTGLVLALIGPFQGIAFGQRAPAISPLALVLQDALVGISIAVTAAIVLVRALQFARALKERLARPGAIAHAVVHVSVTALIGAALVAGIPSLGSAQESTTEPGSPCPSRAPLKTFDVSAINVDITYNRFGDHDPLGKMYVLDAAIEDVRAEEASGEVTLGLRDDAIQPLVIRANNGDCVEIDFTNRTGGGSGFGVHIDGLAYEVGSSGDAVGRNPESVSTGETLTYRYYVPRNPVFEGAHYMHPGPGERSAVSHGLFGALVVEPMGSVYLHPETLAPITSGWEAIIDPGPGASFREGVKLFHEVGNEAFQPSAGGGGILPLIDPTTDAYRPGARALNYRSEPFFNRLSGSRDPHLLKSLAYGSYTFGDPSTPIPRAYLGDPVKFRVMHAGSEVFHVYHLHGGGVRWRLNPRGDTSFDYAATGLDKHPGVIQSPSLRLDSQSIGPGESYNMELEGGAGGVQQAAGDYLWHCHIAHHYVAGMWSFFRTYDTQQADLAPLPDRTGPPTAVTSDDLIGKTMPNGVTITAGNLDDWIRPQLPPQGVPLNRDDATVWDWRIDDIDSARPSYLGEVSSTVNWPNMPNGMPGQPGALPSDQLVRFDGGPRPKIMFNPLNGRPAYPLLRPHIFDRPPFSPNGHSGAPWLGEDGEASPDSPVDPYSGREDAVCPQDTVETRNFNVVAIERPVEVAPSTVDPDGKFFVLAQDKERLLDPTERIEPLAVRANVGDCVALTLTSEQTDADGLDKVNIHAHHVQFDPQGSDGVVSGLQYEQSIRPYRIEDSRLVAAAPEGTSVLSLNDVSKYRPGISIGVGLGTDDIEVHQILSVNPTANTVTLVDRLHNGHPVGQWAGVEFVQYRWYADVQLDNVFWHDHVDGINGWGHGLVGQLVVEPPGSTYHDPVTGQEVESGTIVDIRTDAPVIPSEVDGSFREVVLWSINDSPVAEGGFNIKSEPWGPRLIEDCPALPTDPCADPSLIFSSYAHDDPITPLPRAFASDDVVFRMLHAGPTLDTFRIDGHRFQLENRYFEDGEIQSQFADTLHFGVSERFTVALDGGAGGPRAVPGDYVYMNGVARRMRAGAWGLLRVLSGQIAGCTESPNDPGPKCLQTLPGNSVTTSTTLPEANSQARPPAAAGPGDPCDGAPEQIFDVTSVHLPSGGVRMAYVPSARATAAEAGSFRPEPLVIHVSAGDCLVVNFTNGATDNGSFHVGKLLREIGSSGVNAGFNPEQTVPRGETRTYRYYVDSAKLGSAPITDMGGDQFIPEAVVADAVEPARDGLYGAVVTHAAGSTFTDPVSGEPTRIGTSVDVHDPAGPEHRDFTLLFADLDEKIGGDTMPYRVAVEDASAVNYRQASRPNTTDAFSSLVHGDPSTPLLRAYAGDPTTVHAIVAPGSEQMHVFSLGGLTWTSDPFLHDVNEFAAAAFGPWESIDAVITGGAGGIARGVGDYFYGDLRRPFTEAGLWGIFRVLSDGACPIQPLDGLPCLGQDSLSRQEQPDPEPSPTAPYDGSGGSGGGGGGAVTVSPSPTPSGTGDVTPPEATVGVRPLRFSPNGDGRKDTTAFDIDFSESVDWTMRIMSGSTEVYSSSGEGDSADVRWDGTDNGEPPTEGAYLWILSAQDAAGNKMTSQLGSVVVDLTQPEIGSVAVAPDPFAPSERRNAKLSFTVSERAVVGVVVLRDRRVIRRFDAELVRNGARVVIRWDGRDDAGRRMPDGRYVFRIKATDRAANGPQLTRIPLDII